MKLLSSSVGNTFRKATMQARIFCISSAMTWIRTGLWLNQDPILKKKDNNNKISDEVNVLLVIYW